MPDYTTPTLR